MGIILLAIAVAIGIGVITFITKLQKGEAFQVNKLARTVLIGFIIGVVAVLTNAISAIPRIVLIILATAGAVNIADQVVKFVKNLCVKPA